MCEILVQLVMENGIEKKLILTELEDILPYLSPPKLPHLPTVWTRQDNNPVSISTQTLEDDIFMTPSPTHNTAERLEVKEPNEIAVDNNIASNHGNGAS